MYKKDFKGYPWNEIGVLTERPYVTPWGEHFWGFLFSTNKTNLILIQDLNPPQCGHVFFLSLIFSHQGKVTDIFLQVITLTNRTEQAALYGNFSDLYYANDEISQTRSFSGTGGIHQAEPRHLLQVCAVKRVCRIHNLV